MRVQQFKARCLTSSPSLSAGHGSSKFALTPWTACCWSKISCTSVQLTGAPVAPAQLAQCWLMVPGATRAAGWGCRLAGQLRPHPPPRCSGVVRRCVCARPQPREEAAAWCLLLRTFTSTPSADSRPAGTCSGGCRESRRDRHPEASAPSPVQGGGVYG